MESYRAEDGAEDAGAEAASIGGTIQLQWLKIGVGHTTSLMTRTRLVTVDESKRMETLKEGEDGDGDGVLTEVEEEDEDEGVVVEEEEQSMRVIMELLTLSRLPP